MSSSSEKDVEGEWIDVARAEAVAVPSDKESEDPRLLATTDEVPRPPVELPSRIVGEYEVLSPLGSGGMGEVFKARHRRLNKLVALKLLPADSQHLREAAARFQREMQAVGDLDHPNVVEAHDAGEQSGVVYLAMKLIDGIDLQRLVKQRGPLPISEACELIRQAALGLHYLHQRGLVHRDVKPSNLMRTADGTVKVLDLGLARRCVEPEKSHSLTGLWRAMGTPDYLAPEQIENAADADARADLYGLGGTLFYLLTGTAPFAGHQSLFSKLDAHRLEPPPDVRTLRPEVPVELAALIQRLLAKKPEERFQTAAEAAAALVPFVDHSSPEKMPTSSWEMPPSLVREAGKPNRREGRKLAFGVSVGKWSCTLTLALGTALAVLLALPLWWYIGTLRHDTNSTSQVASKLPEAMHVPALPGPARASAPIHVMSLEVMLTRSKNNAGLPQGKIGEKVFEPRWGDHATVQTHLTRRAYAFLIAFQANGRVEVCFPEKDNEPPTHTDKPSYPSTAASGGDAYELSDGEGLQAFAVVVSSQPLPSFKEWWSNHSKNCPWKKETAEPGVVYRGNGEDPVEPLVGDNQRSKGAKAMGKQMVSGLAQWLRKIPGVETVQVLGFAVGPQQKN
jgi:serine/threonine protein kinase